MDWEFNVMKKDDYATIGAVLFLAVLGLIFGPLLTILALNTLLPVLAIPYTFGTWAATFFLFFVIRAKVKKQ